MNKFLILLILFIASCTSMIDDNVFFIDKEIRDSYDSFIQEAGFRGYSIQKQNLIIKFDDDIDSFGQTIHGKIIYVYINEEFWLISDHIIKEGILFHELGHAILNRGHEPYPNESIMNSPLNLMQYKNNREQYLDELFNN